jgi:hypothetical protein
MGRGSPEKKQRQAIDIARQLTVLKDMEGVPWLEQGRLWLLSPPAARPADPHDLAQALVADTLPGRAEFQRLAGAEQGTPLDVGRLTMWARAVTELDGRRDLEALVEEGVRPLRRYRGVDLRARIVAAARQLQRLGRLAQGLEAAVLCQQAADDLSAEVLVQALPLRLYALGNWPVDPVEELLALDLPAEAPLQRIALETNDPGLAILAALLLGARRRHAASEGVLPSHLAGAFQLGQFGCSAPCLAALALVQGATLPDQRDLPRAEQASVLQAAERVALLQGIPAALAALGNLSGPLEDVGRVQARLRRLEELVRAHEQGRALRSPDEALVGHWLRQLSTPGVGAARVLAGLFLSWMEGEPGGRLLPRRALQRQAEQALPHGLAAAVRAMAGAWLTAYRSSETVSRQTSHSSQTERLALALTFPGVTLPVPAPLDAAELRSLREALAQVSGERLREVWPVLVTDEGRAWLRRQGGRPFLVQLLRADVPAALVLRAIRLDVVDPACDLAANPRTLASYLDCVEALSTREIPNLDVQRPWFASLFRAGRPWASSVVLTLLSAASKGPAEGQPAELFALAQALAGPGPLAPVSQGLVRRLEEWNRPAVGQPSAELEALAALPALERSHLEEYLHHRRLSGHGETFAAALLEPLHLAEAEERETAFLLARLAVADLDAAERARLEPRLARLTDLALAQSRRLQTAERARKRLERSLPLLRRESLDRVLDDACRTYLRDFLGQAVPPGPLPSGLRGALQLLSSWHIDHDLLAGFLADVLQGRPLAERPANREWLARAESAGIRTRTWLAGFRATISVAGTPITFTTERDPLAVLEMGTWFDTCLSLKGGINSASTLVNALDVNKQVIYGRRPDGVVVARKLIGATLRRELAGYHTFAAEHDEELQQGLAGALQAFAQQCGLRPSDSATPEVLHDAFWYDDGNESWVEPGPGPADLEPPPAPLPSDPYTASEWNFQAGLKDNDPQRLEAILFHGRSVWRAAALYHLLLHHHRGPRELAGRFNGFGDADLVLACLTRKGQLAAVLSLAQASEGFPSDTLPWLPCNCLPFDAGTMRAALRLLPEMVRTRPLPIWASPSNCPLPGFLAILPIDQLLGALRLLGELFPRAEQVEPSHIEQFADLLQTAWLRDREASPLLRALAEQDQLVERVIVALARREVVPQLASSLRKLLARPGADQEGIGLALGTQGEPADGPRLLALLRERPGSLKLAAAVVRTGHAVAAEEARSLWRPPRSFRSEFDDHEWFALAREVGSRRLARALSREVRRQVRRYQEEQLEGRSPDNDPLRAWTGLVLQLAFLALPGPEGDARALMNHIADTIPAQLARSSFRYYEEMAARLARAGAVEIWADRLEQGGPAALEALAWWKEAHTRTVTNEQVSKLRPRHDRFERAMRRLAVAGSPAERVAALDAWLAQTPLGLQTALVTQWLALFGPERFHLPAELRLSCARICRSGATHLTLEVLEVMLAWLEGLPAEDQRAVFLDDAGGFPKLAILTDSDWPVWLFRLDSADPEQARPAQVLLEAWATASPDNGLLDALQEALLWLRPEVSEALVSRTFAEINATALADTDLLIWLTVEDPRRSYRIEQAVLSELLPRLEPDRRASLLRALIDRLRPQAEKEPRRRYLLDQAESLLKAPV